MKKSFDYDPCLCLSQYLYDELTTFQTAARVPIVHHIRVNELSALAAVRKV